MNQETTSHRHILICVSCIVAIVSISALLSVDADAQMQQATEESNTSGCSNYVVSNSHSSGCDPFRYYLMPHSVEQASYVALDGSGMVLLGEGQPRLQYGVGALGGYDSAFAGRANLSAPFAGGQAYVAFNTVRPRWRMILQDSGGGISYQAVQGTTQYFNQTALTAGGEVSSTKAWSFDVSNTIANDAIRILAPLNTTATGGINTPSPETAAYGINTGLLLDNQAVLGLQMQTSATRSWLFSIRNDYRNFFDDNAQINTARGRIQYQVEVSPLTTFGLYEETAGQTGIIDCTTQSIGGYVQRQLGHGSYMQLGGGPAFGTKDCVVTKTFTAFGGLTSQFRKNTTIYASGSRKLNDSPVQNATWENTVQAGLIQRFDLKTYMRIDGGYLRGTTPTNTSQFDGSFIGGNLSRQLAAGFSLQLTARHYQWSGITSSATDRNVFFATIWWTRHPEQSTTMTASAFAQR